MARIRGLTKLDKHNPCKGVWNQYVARPAGMFGQRTDHEPARLRAERVEHQVDRAILTAETNPCSAKP